MASEFRSPQSRAVGGLALLGDCVCLPGYVQSPWRERAYGDPPTCLSCDDLFDGATCDGFGTTLATVRTQPLWWRPTANALNFTRCAFGTCVGGYAEGTAFDSFSTATCANGTGGPWCEQCTDRTLYFDQQRQQCEDCAASLPGGIALLLAVAALVLAFVLLVRRLNRRGGARWRRLVRAYLSFSVRAGQDPWLRAKAKILFSFCAPAAPRTRAPPPTLPPAQPRSRPRPRPCSRPHPPLRLVWCSPVPDGPSAARVPRPTFADDGAVWPQTRSSFKWPSCTSSTSRRLSRGC